MKKEKSRSVGRSVAALARPRSQVHGRKLAGVSVSLRRRRTHSRAYMYKGREREREREREKNKERQRERDTYTRTDGTDGRHVRTHARTYVARTYVRTHARTQFSSSVWKSLRSTALFATGGLPEPRAHTCTRHSSHIDTRTPIYLPIPLSLFHSASFPHSIFLFLSLSFPPSPPTVSLSLSLSLDRSLPLSSFSRGIVSAQPVDLYMSSVARGPRPSFSLFPLVVIFLSPFFFLRASWFTLLLRLYLSRRNVASGSYVLGFHSDWATDDDDETRQCLCLSTSDFTRWYMARTCCENTPGDRRRDLSSICPSTQSESDLGAPSPLDYSSPGGFSWLTLPRFDWTDRHLLVSGSSSPILAGLATTHRLVYVDGFFLTA